MTSYPSLTLYRFDGACSIVCNAFLRDLGIPFKTVLMHYGPEGNEAADGSFSNADYRKIHHLGHVPALAVDGVVLTENTAILTYVASLTPQGHSLLGGDNLLDRAHVVSWTTWMSGTMHSWGGGYGMLYHPYKFTDREEDYPVVQEKGRKLLRICYERIESHLASGRDYFVGSDVTIVEYFSLVFWIWGNKQGFGLTEKYPNYGKLIQKMEARKGVREALVEEKQVITFG